MATPYIHNRESLETHDMARAVQQLRLVRTAMMQQTKSTFGSGRAATVSLRAEDPQ
ncbi:MAG TPA: hypothetical protein VIR00_08245 [Micromonosporaceae bacterium]|jgi:outer membrane lipopolysaccharide assembly protein LptE/RlpB